MKIPFSFLPVMALLLLNSCNKTTEKEDFDPASYVNMQIGTKSSNTFVTAVYPFGMVSPGPFYNAEKGQKLDKTRTVGFSHIHASGVGCGDIWGAISLMPVSGDGQW
ncbi:MAG TPA: glycoside hydrolase family 92 protein, partial [Bacteroidales bacterium]|nr:glycoside hydrolase family 92 protein [Bacteroidales bacterium]